MENIRVYLEEQLLDLTRLMMQSENNLKRYKNLPEKVAKVHRSGGQDQFYLRTIGSDKYDYVKKSDYKDLTKYLQKEYELKANKKLKQLKGKLEKFIQSFNINELNEIYEGMPLAKRELVTPIYKNDDEYIAEWLTNNPGNQNSFPEDGIYKTNRGELVRSKSEKIIADALDKYGIPYQYEPALELGNSTMYPDFVVLNVRRRKTYYWEHLGMVSDPTYAVKNYKKELIYERNGFIRGKNLLMTLESTDMKLEVKIVEQMIKEFLL